MPSTISFTNPMHFMHSDDPKKKYLQLSATSNAMPSSDVISPLSSLAEFPSQPFSGGRRQSITINERRQSITISDRRQSITLSVAPLRRSSVCALVPQLLACSGSNMLTLSGHENTGREAPLPRLTDKSVSHPTTSGTKSKAQDSAPTLLHRVNHTQSILALAVSKKYIFAGSQTGEILIWSLDTFQRVASLQGHRGSVLCLTLSEDESLLFSSAGDAIINVWDPETFENLYSVYSTYDVGDVFCVAYSPTLKTMYFGAQNTSIQWYDLNTKDSRPRPDLASHPSRRNHIFFDSHGSGGGAAEPLSAIPTTSQLLEIDPENIVHYAHYGYVYCMLLVQLSSTSDIGRNGEEILLSGGGDGAVKLWSLRGGKVQALRTLSAGESGVLSMIVQDGLLYCGLIGGEIAVWDLDTCQLVRTSKSHSNDVLTMSIKGDYMFSGSASGYMRKWNQRFECITRWQSHTGLVATSALTTRNNRLVLITGGNDATVTIWDVSPSEMYSISPKSQNDQLLSSLSKLVSFHTISNNPIYTEDCRRGATYLRTLFKRFGAISSLLPAGGQNPIVYARFKAQHRKKGKTVLFYGHYDVIHADSGDEAWSTDPFELTGVNGYLYGRGVSDNKGPILAALFAAGELAQAGELEGDLVFLIEGEEESGSRGFAEAVKRNKALIGDVDWVILANSHWLDDEVPCLTYGLRGSIHATVTVESEKPDLHAGVNGSRLNREPTIDLINLLAKLTDETGAIKIPGFANAVREITPAEENMYSAITEKFVKNPTWSHYTEAEIQDNLMSKWRFPTLTIHRVSVSGPSSASVIPHAASASISLRIVPDQEVGEIKGNLVSYLGSEYKRFKSGNHLTVTIDHESEPWMGNPENEAFKTLEAAITEEWSEDGKVVKPLYIREGGSIPAAGFLEKEFHAMAAHLPCGQASDHAHLDNERMRLVNLYKSKAILKKVFGELPTK